MLINLDVLRKIDIKKEIDEFLEQNRYKMMLPDQDIISCLYGNKTIILDDIIIEWKRVQSIFAWHTIWKLYIAIYTSG